MMSSSDPTQHLPQQGFCTVFWGLTINSWVFPHHPGHLCYPKVSPTTLEHMENRTWRRFARRIQQDFEFLKKKKTKLKIPH